MYIKRDAEYLLSKIIKSRKVLIVLGARQVGKTTLINHFLKGKKTTSLNLDIDVDISKLLACSVLSPNDALKSLGSPDYIVIDEAQRNIETSRIVKGWHDSKINAKIILLGSSSLNLLYQASESLTGRNEKLLLPPFLFKEIIQNQPWYSSYFTDEQLRENFSAQIKSLLLQNLVYGSYPEAITSSNKESFLLNMVSDYLLKDILQIGLIKTQDLIKRLLMLLAYQVGSEVSVNELSANLGISRQTIERYIELLEQTYVIFRLKAFSTNQRKEIAKSQKIYFWDIGIRNALLKEFSLSEFRSDIGLLWENWVIAEFAKHNFLTGELKNLYFWRSKAKSEVDLVVKEGNKLNAYEIKWRKQNINKRAFERQYGTEVKIISSENPLLGF